MGHLSVPAEVPFYFLLLVKGQILAPSHTAKAKDCTCRDAELCECFVCLSVYVPVNSSFSSIPGKCSLPGRSPATQGSLPFWKQLSPWQGCNPMAPACRPGLFLFPLLDPHLQEDCYPSPKVPGNVSLIFGTSLSFLKRHWLCWPEVALEAKGV